MPQPDKQGQEERLGLFMAERQRLMRLAYRYLGSVSEAEDVVQDCWLRFCDREDVTAPERYLPRIVTRLCLDRLKAARTRRETYVGPWLPEPVPDPADETAEAGDAVLDISFAVMRALERLSPLERAAFFLHDLYEVPFDEIAETIGRTPAACRQLAARGRKAIASARSRFAPTQADVERLVKAIAAAAQSGNVETLGRMLAADVEFVSDGGGRKKAALNVVRGRDRVARLLVGLTRKSDALTRFSVVPTKLNGAPSILLIQDGEIDQSMSFDLDAEGGIAGIYVVRNPVKLAHLAADGAAASQQERGEGKPA